jgi:hypothetical protein
MIFKSCGNRDHVALTIKKRERDRKIPHINWEPPGRKYFLNGLPAAFTALVDIFK